MCSISVQVLCCLSEIFLAGSWLLVSVCVTRRLARRLACVHLAIFVPCSAVSRLVHFILHVYIFCLYSCAKAGVAQMLVSREVLADTKW